MNRRYGIEVWAVPAALALLLGLAGMSAEAHRLSPAFFGLTETPAGGFAAQWKVSIPGGLADALEPKVPEGCAISDAVRSHVVDDARLLHATIACDGPLAGREFVVDGLAATETDVLFRIDWLDGRSFTHRLVPAAPSVEIPAASGRLDVMQTYLVLGIEHILLGIDHLLFVLALLLLVSGVGRVIATITAFTVAHSITLAAATLGFVSLPSAPVEAVIALSILFLATELARSRLIRGTRTAEPGRAGREATLAVRFPWLVAFAFGLLHGFGFAGALSEVGLPPRAIPLALAFFNFGVEIGQVSFVLALLGCGSLLARISLAPPAWAPRVTAYVIGSVAAFWVIERTLLVL